MIDGRQVLAAPPVATRASWCPDDVVRYHLALGAGATMSAHEVDYMDERRVRPLPSFSVISAGEAAAAVTYGPGLEFDRTRIVHGEHSIEVGGRLPSRA